jgi:hypothetical protein
MTTQPETPYAADQSSEAGLEFLPKRIEPVPLRSIICMAQIRDTDNPQFEDLKQSIIANGLDNPPNIAFPTRWQLIDYIHFTNNAWGSSADIDDYDDRQLPDGRYALAVAGHNRLAALNEIADMTESSTGKSLDPIVWCKVEPDASVEGIISVQTAENLHAKPRTEREAMAAVALYLHGLGTKWQNGEEFIEINKNRVNPVLLKDGLWFSELSPQLRGLVFGRHIPYMAGIELGKMTRMVRQAFALESGINHEDLIDEDSMRELEGAVQDRLLSIAAHILNSPTKLNSTAAQNYVKGAARILETEIQKCSSEQMEGVESGQEFLFSEFLVSATQQAHTIRRREQVRKAKLIAEIGSRPFATTSEIMTLLAGEDRSEIVTDVLVDTRQADANFARHLEKN